ncbi:MAG TPA: hypothetical protein VF258_01295, partial [Luteolibacter sp.]
MKITAIKLTMAISMLSASLVGSTWAAPRGKLNHSCHKQPTMQNESRGHAHIGSVWFLKTSPRSKR